MTTKPLYCLAKHAFGKQPGHAQFYYPKRFGYGEIWLRIADYIKDNIEYNRTVESIDFDSNTVAVVDGERYSGNIIITTIPWIEYVDIYGMPENIRKTIFELKHSSIQTEYFQENKDTEAQWIYYPDLELPYHRILVRHNFCPNSKGYWTETNSDRILEEKSVGDYKYYNKYDLGVKRVTPF